MSPTTGKTKKKLPPLASVQSVIALTSHSPNGAYLGGLTHHGDMFLWKKDTDSLETFVTPLSRMDSEPSKMSPLAFQGAMTLHIACVPYYLLHYGTVTRSSGSHRQHTCTCTCTCTCKYRLHSAERCRSLCVILRYLELKVIQWSLQ